MKVLRTSSSSIVELEFAVVERLECGNEPRLSAVQRRTCRVQSV